MSSHPEQKMTTAGFLLGVVVIVAVSAVSYARTLQFQDDAIRVTHTQTVLTRLASLMSSVTDAETGQRGYALTGADNFLEPYRSALGRIDAEYSALRSLTADNPEQQQKLDELKPLLARRMAMLSEGIDVRRTQGLAVAARQVALGTGKALHDQIRLIVGTMAQMENLLLFERQEASRRAARYSLVSIVLGGLVACALILLSLRGVLRELARRRAAESALEDSNAALRLTTERAQQADRMKSAFLATMSHELRTPLNSIIGFTGILRQEMAGPLNPEQARQLDMVRNSARHLLALINDVLDISKIEAGELKISPERFDLRAAIDSAVAGIAPLAQAKGLALTVTIEPEIAEVVSDRRRLEQVLINLLGNAVKFTEQGEVALEAERLPAARGVLIRVRDTGSGIKPEDLATLFRPFQQIDTGLARQHEGTGLGLAICGRLVNLLGGRIEAESQWGRGSTFTVRLPLAAEESP